MKNSRQDSWIEIHNIKLVKYGSSHHMDCDLTLPWYINIADAHAESDNLKKIISDNYRHSIDLTIHADACHGAFAGITHFRLQCRKHPTTASLTGR
ncbi:MAG: cation transporter dimerization domain-containing protein [Bacteroidales bacterium]